MSDTDNGLEEVQVSLEIYPKDGGTVQLVQQAVGLQTLVNVTLDPGEQEGTAVCGLTLSCVTAEEALDLLGLATLALHNYLGAEGK